MKAVAQSVRERGFRRSGNNLRYETRDALQFISFQSSDSSTSTSLVVTVNVGCELKKLHEWLRSGRNVNSAQACLWNLRLGEFGDSPRDRWWTVTDLDSLTKTMHEIEALLPRAIEKMNNLSTEEGVRNAFEIGELKGKRFQELRAFIDRPEGSEYWPGWDAPLTDS